MSWVRLATWSALAALVLFGCVEESDSLPPTPASAPPAVASPAPNVNAAGLTARLPPEDGPFAPARTLVDPSRPPTGELLTDVETCEECHRDVAAQWRSSAHHFASFNNPIYRTSIDRFREEVGRKESRFCAGCHDPALLVDGAMDEEVSSSDPRARVGVTCRTCHGIVATRPGGNGSYELRGTDIPRPDPGDPASIEAHKRAVANEPLRTAALCAACHQAFLGPETGHHHHLPGANDATPWRRSGYAGAPLARVDKGVPQKICQDCHMPERSAPLGDAAAKGGQVKSHRFAAGHTWLAAMLDDDEQREQADRLLATAAVVDIAVATQGERRGDPAENLDLRTDGRVIFDVVVTNLGVGHKFPGGTIDAQDTFLEVEVSSRDGRRLAAAGRRHKASGRDDTAHRLRAELVDEAGTPLRAREVERFRAVAFDHTIPPRDSSVVQFAFDPPPRLTAADLPLTVRARLWHRSRPVELAERTCRESASPRGRAFAAAGAPDPCVRQPLTLLSETTLLVGGQADDRVVKGRDALVRLTAHGKGMLHAVQERLEEARASLEAALALVETEGTPFDRTVVLSLLGTVSSKQGRTDEALELFERARREGTDHPSLSELSGRALAQVWRFEEARPFLEAAVVGVPGDDASIARLAVTLGSLQADEAALEAAQRGLLVEPRHPDLLRVQALALRGLGAPADVVEAAHAAYLDHRTADDGAEVGARCADRFDACALERNPVHVHVMRPDSP